MFQPGQCTLSRSTVLFVWTKCNARDDIEMTWGSWWYSSLDCSLRIESHVIFGCFCPKSVNELWPKYKLLQALLHIFHSKTAEMGCSTPTTLSRGGGEGSKDGWIDETTYQKWQTPRELGGPYRSSDGRTSSHGPKQTWEIATKNSLKVKHPFKAQT